MRCRRFAGVHAERMYSSAAKHPREIRETRLEKVWVRGRFQSADGLGEFGCAGHRCGNFAADGGKRANRVCVGPILEKCGSGQGAGARRFPAESEELSDCRLAVSLRMWQTSPRRFPI